MTLPSSVTLADDWMAQWSRRTMLFPAGVRAEASEESNIANCIDTRIAYVLTSVGFYASYSRYSDNPVD